MVDNEIESTFVVGFKIDDSNLENQLNSIKNLIQNAFNQGLGVMGGGGGQPAAAGAAQGAAGGGGVGGQPPFAQAVVGGPVGFNINTGGGDINITGTGGQPQQFVQGQSNMNIGPNVLIAPQGQPQGQIGGLMLPNHKTSSVRTVIEFLTQIIVDPVLAGIMVDDQQNILNLVAMMEQELGNFAELTDTMTMDAYQQAAIANPNSPFGAVKSAVPGAIRNLLIGIGPAIVGQGAEGGFVGFHSVVNEAMRFAGRSWLGLYGAKGEYMRVEHAALQELGMFFTEDIMGKEGSLESKIKGSARKFDHVQRYMLNGIESFTHIEYKSGKYKPDHNAAVRAKMQTSVHEFITKNRIFPASSDYYKTVIQSHGMVKTAMSDLKEIWKSVIHHEVFLAKEVGIVPENYKPSAYLLNLNNFFYYNNLEEMLSNPQFSGMKIAENIQPATAIEQMKRVLMKYMLSDDTFEMLSHQIPAEVIMMENKLALMTDFGQVDSIELTAEQIIMLNARVGKKSVYNPLLEAGGGIFDPVTKQEIKLGVNFLRSGAGPQELAHDTNKALFLDMAAHDIDMSAEIKKLMSGYTIKPGSFSEIIDTLAGKQITKGNVHWKPNDPHMKSYLDILLSKIDQSDEVSGLLKSMHKEDYLNIAQYGRLFREYNALNKADPANADLAAAKLKNMQELFVKFMGEDIIIGTDAHDQLNNWVAGKHAEQQIINDANMYKNVPNAMNMFGNSFFENPSANDYDKQIQNSLDNVYDFGMDLDKSFFNMMKPNNVVRLFMDKMRWGTPRPWVEKMQRYGSEFMGDLAANFETEDKGGERYKVINYSPIKKRFINFLFPFYQSGQLNTPEGIDLLNGLRKDWGFAVDDALKYLETSSDMDIRGSNSIFMEDNFTDIHANWLGNKSIDFFQKSNVITQSLKLMTSHDIKSRLIAGEGISGDIKTKADKVIKLIGTYGGLVRLGHVLQENLDGDIANRGAKIPQNSLLHPLGDTNGEVIEVMEVIKEVIAKLYPEGGAEGYDVFKNIEWLSSHSLNIVVPTDLTVWSNL